MLFLAVLLARNLYDAAITYKDVAGILLGGLVIFFVTVSNFEVVLEVPYYGIPAWVSIGIFFRHMQNLREEK